MHYNFLFDHYKNIRIKQQPDLNFILISISFSIQMLKYLQMFILALMLLFQYYFFFLTHVRSSLLSNWTIPYIYKSLIFVPEAKGFPGIIPNNRNKNKLKKRVLKNVDE